MHIVLQSIHGHHTHGEAKLAICSGEITRNAKQTSTSFFSVMACSLACQHRICLSHLDTQDLSKGELDVMSIKYCDDKK